MAETVYTIPINAAFDQKDGCPLCRMRDKLEEQTLDYTLGAAMMEPDVRISMNHVGFCRNHLQALRQRKNKLALALILESHLDELLNAVEQPSAGSKRGIFSKKNDGADAADELSRFASGCFVCDRITGTEKRYAANTAWLWETDKAFRDKVKAQPFLCLSHSALLLRAAKATLKPENYQSLYETLTLLLQKHVSSLRQDVTAFTVSFDHRNADVPLSDEARTAVDRSLEWLR